MHSAFEMAILQLPAGVINSTTNASLIPLSNFTGTIPILNHWILENN